MLYVRKKISPEEKVYFYKSMERETARVFIKSYELIFLGLLLAVVGILIFPKGEIERYLERGKEYNVDLTIAYLKILSKVSQDYNTKVKYEKLLIERLLSAGEETEALQRLLSLQEENIKNWDLKVLRYILFKGLYFSGKLNKSIVEKELENLYELSAGDERKLDFVFNEGISMYVPKVVYRASYDLYRLTKNRDMAKIAYGYASYYRDQKAIGELSKVLDLEITTATPDISSLIKSFEVEEDKDKREKLFSQILDLAIAQYKYDLLVELVDKYGDEFIGNRQMEHKMVSYLLMSERPDKAGELVRKVFKERKE